MSLIIATVLAAAAVNAATIPTSFLINEYQTFSDSSCATTPLVSAFFASGYTYPVPNTRTGSTLTITCTAGNVNSTSAYWSPSWTIFKGDVPQWPYCVMTSNVTGNVAATCPNTGVCTAATSGYFKNPCKSEPLALEVTAYSDSACATKVQELTALTANVCFGTFSGGSMKLTVNTVTACGQLFTYSDAACATQVGTTALITACAATASTSVPCVNASGLGLTGYFVSGSPLALPPASANATTASPTSGVSSLSSGLLGAASLIAAALAF